MPLHAFPEESESTIRRCIIVIVSNDHLFIANKQAFQKRGKFQNVQTALKMSAKPLKWYFGKWGGSPSSNLQHVLWSPYLHGLADTLSAVWHSSDPTQDLDIFSSTLSSLRGDRSSSERGAHGSLTFFCSHTYFVSDLGVFKAQNVKTSWYFKCKNNTV